MTAQQKSSTSRSSRVTTESSRSDHTPSTPKFQSTIGQMVHQQALQHCRMSLMDVKHSHSVVSPSKCTEEVEKSTFIKREPNHSDPNIDSKLREQDLKNRVKRVEEQERLLRQKAMKAESKQLIKDKGGVEIENELKRTSSITSMGQSDNSISPSMTPIRSGEIIHHLQTMQADMQHLTSKNEVLQEKMEEQKHETEGLNTRIVTLENEKIEAERIRLVEGSKLKLDLTNIKMSYDQTLTEMGKEIGCKETHCQEMKAEIHDYDKRLQLVEADKSKTEQELRELKKEMQSFKHDLEQQESEIVNLKRDLEEKIIANNTLSKQVGELKMEIVCLLEDKERREKYIKEREEKVLDLKCDLTKLRTDNRKLEQEKKQFLGRFGKPVVNHKRTLHK